MTDAAKPGRQTGADRRVSLLKAALELFSTQGYDGATTRAIAERAGVTEALLFKHFHTKQELLRALVEEYGPRVLFTPPPDSIRATGIEEALRTLLQIYLDTFWTNRAWLRMLFMATERDRAAFEELQAQFGSQTLYLFTFLVEREENREIKRGAAGPATDLLSAAIGGFLQRTLRDEPGDWNAARSRFIDHTLTVILTGIRAAADTEKR